MKGDTRLQKPYKKTGDTLIYKVELKESTFKKICEILKVTRVGEKEIDEILTTYSLLENHECTMPDEPPNDPNDLD